MHSYRKLITGVHEFKMLYSIHANMYGSYSMHIRAYRKENVESVALLCKYCSVMMHELLLLHPLSEEKLSIRVNGAIYLNQN